MARVLICDDAAFMRIILRNILEKAGFEVCAEAKNGAEAVDKFRVTVPDIVTMDITMPEMSGIEALKAIMVLDKTAIVVMCSAMGQQALVVEAIQSGAKDFIIKPFDAERVIQALNKFV